METSVIIVGAGVVGKNIAKELDTARIPYEYHDPRLGLNAEKVKAQYAIICVPTEMKEGGACDTSIVRKVCEEWRRRVPVVIIKSTVPPGTTTSIRGKKRGAAVVFSPEFYGATVNSNTPSRFAIIGADSVAEGEKAMELFKRAYPSQSRFFLVDTKTAELVKYAENTWLGMQVTFFAQMHRITKALGVSQTMFREALLLDERIARAHSLTFGDAPHYSSHCLNKDIPALRVFCEERGIPAPFVQAIIESNEAFKK